MSNDSCAPQPFILEYLPSVDSTNSELLRRASHSSIHRRAVYADVQTAGRGQRGRRWFAEAGDALLLSVGWTFPRAVRLDGLSLVVGVVLARALATFASERITLKWPNDVLLDDREKLAGILVETLPDISGGRSAVIGIGINVRSPKRYATERFEPDSLPPAGLVSAMLPRHADGAAIVCAALRDAVLRELSESLPLFERDGLRAFRDQWLARCAFANREVRVIEAGTASGQSYVGRIVDIAHDGALMVHDGRALHTLHSSAVSLRPA